MNGFGVSRAFCLGFCLFFSISHTIGYFPMVLSPSWKKAWQREKGDRERRECERVQSVEEKRLGAAWLLEALCSLDWRLAGSIIVHQEYVDMMNKSHG